MVWQLQGPWSEKIPTDSAKEKKILEFLSSSPRKLLNSFKLFCVKGDFDVISYEFMYELIL